MAVRFPITWTLVTKTEQSLPQSVPKSCHFILSGFSKVCYLCWRCSRISSTQSCTMLIWLWSPLSQQVLFSYFKLVTWLPGIIQDPAAGLCWNLPLWIKSCWQFIVKTQVSVLTSTAFPLCVRVLVCVCVALTIPVSHCGLYRMKVAGTVTVSLVKTGKDR